MDNTNITTRRDLNNALRTAKYIFVWASIMDHGDGVYVQVSKAALVRTLPATRADDAEYRGVIRADEPDALYIG